jgi:hypothetical protein
LSRTYPLTLHRHAAPAAADATCLQLSAFRDTVAERVHARIGDIAAGKVSAPTQLTIVATCLLTALINHEYQHDQWISEVRADHLGHPLPADPDSEHVRRIDGYLVLTLTGLERRTRNLA